MGSHRAHREHEGKIFRNAELQFGRFFVFAVNSWGRPGKLQALTPWLPRKSSRG